ncbi:MAG TPA: sigma-54 dependent transcriptional regulator [Planctomycetota bacterium]|nr:sigma-54 dependent transcriptional regulator [Planctomycetota bacterium]
MTEPVRSQLSVLVVDDEQNICDAIARSIGPGYRVVKAHSAEEALVLLKKDIFDIALCDIRLPGMDGLTFMDQLLVADPATTAIIITGYASVETAVQALKRGAYDYLVKPFEPEEIRQIVSRAAERRRLRLDNEAWRQAATSATGERGIYRGESVAMRRLFERIDQVAATDAPVFLVGESGSGKEVLAHYIHSKSPRSSRPMVAVNCATFSEEMMISEVFGHIKGAFTGAVSDRRGCLEMAHEGTLLLDEIAEFKPELQSRLLRVVEDQQVTRLGSERPIHVNVRFVAASQKDPKELVKSGKLREDLYFRLGVVTLEVPPLRERADEIPGMAEYLLSLLRRDLKKEISGLDPAAAECLKNYAWPGNVRELRNVLERAVIFTPQGQPITVRDLPESVRKSKLAEPFIVEETTPLSMEQMDERYAAFVLKQCEGNRTKAAKILGIAPSTLWRREQTKENP